VPVTGGHPAAVLPLLRTPLPASALVAGSLAPDVPSYLRAAAVAVAFRGGGVLLATAVVLALVAVLPARVRRGTGTDRRRPG
jgi:hypothetical protein